MHLSPGMKVVEIGPGKGSYTKSVASRVLPDGVVYAIDQSQYVIERLAERIEREDLAGIVPKIDDAHNFSFENNSIDVVFAVTCLPEIPDPVRVLKECKRILKPGGVISLCELFLDPDYPLRRTEKRWAKEAGLDFFEQHGNWFAYQLNFKKP